MKVNTKVYNPYDCDLDYTLNDTYRRRDEVLKQIGMTYEQFLKSDHWLQTKHKASKRANYQRCERCKCQHVELHHVSYKSLGTDDELRNVLAFCRTCHQMIHDLAELTGVSVRLCSRLLRSKKQDEKMLKFVSKINPNFIEIFNRFMSQYS